jgi:hypothetical protein
MARCTTQVAEGQGLQVLTCTGRPDEAELAFAGLADLMRPLYPYLSQMPAPQAEALRAALGLGPAAESDRFVVFASALTLLLQAAAAVPTVIVADNLHLLDAPTRDVLAFLARRVLDEPVGMVLTLTDPSEGPDFEASDPWSSVPVLRLAGLQPAAANDLVTRALDRQVPHRVVASLVDRTGGNPLALLQLVSALESDMLPDVAHAALALPMPQVAVRIFGPRLDELDAKAFDVLALTCAYDPPVPTSVLFDAAERVGFGAAEFETLAGQGLSKSAGANCACYTRCFDPPC